MDCPHCHQPLPGIPCPHCGQEAPEGAEFCPHCGQALSGPQEDTSPRLSCLSCRKPLPPGANYCPHCGEPAPDPELVPEEEAGLGRRIACADGNCIGIIGPDGRCTECGKPYPGELPAEQGEE